MNIVLCESAGRREFTAGNKARTDTVNILLGHGYKHISLYTSKNKKPLVMLQMICACIKTILLAGKNDTVLVQYPYYPSIVNNILFNLLFATRKLKHFRVVVLIHDSIGLRSNADVNIIRRELALLDRMDVTICHNERMVEKFRESGGKGLYRVLGPFDYLYNGPLADKNTTYSNKTIVIAGNLSRQKSAYIYQLNDITDHCHYNLYGIGYDGKDTENVSYKGAFSPDELISQLQGQYGLVWDGESCDTCSGAFGEYLKYNNPHKFSLYLAAGLPVIIWKSAALAVYVEKYGLGMCIDSLKELDSRLSAITSDDYLRMVENVAKYRKSLVNGCHLKEALD